MMDELPPTLLPQTPVPEYNSVNVYNNIGLTHKGRGRPRRSSSNANLIGTSTNGTSLSLTINRSSNQNLTNGNGTKRFADQGRKYNTKFKNQKMAEPSKSTETECYESDPKTILRSSGKTADWDEFLSDGNNLFFVPSVSMFKHAPLADTWKDFSIVGRVFEVANPFVRCSRPVNWIARVIHFAGYKALVEFECLGVTPKFMSWMSYCSNLPRPIGYSDQNRIVLHPPHEVREEYPDFLDRAREVLKNDACITIPPDHHDTIVTAIMKCQKYSLDTKLEVMDKTKICRMRVATVTALVGDRIHVSYVIEPKPGDAGFWFNVNSELVHPIGWSQTVEHEIFGVPRSAKFTPLSKDNFPKYPDEVKLARGQLLEVRHPGQPRTICAAVVHRVLKYGYFVVEIKVLPEEVKQSTKFTYHVTSPYVFYCGFCEKHGIKLVPPYGESQETFTWDNFMRRLNLVKAPLDLLPSRPAHNFKPGMKIESIDVTLPSYLGPSTVLKSAGHLLYIHFDGWKMNSSIEPAEVWVDAESPDIYPIGYAEMVGHEFQSCVEPVDPSNIIHYTTGMEAEIEGVERDDDDTSTASAFVAQT